MIALEEGVGVDAGGNPVVLFSSYILVLIFGTLSVAAAGGGVESVKDVLLVESGG